MESETPEEVVQILKKGEPKLTPKKALTPIQGMQDTIQGNRKRIREIQKIQRTIGLPQKPRGLMVSKDESELLKRSTMGSAPFTKAELEQGYRVLKG